MMKQFGAVVVGLVMLIPVVAAQETANCEETQFRKHTAEKYLQAELLLFGQAGGEGSDPAAALASIESLRKMDLNCYERSAIARLSAVSNLQTKNYLGAIAELENLIGSGTLDSTARTKTHYQIGQIHLLAGEIKLAADNLETWQESGGALKKQHYLQLAQIHHQLGDVQRAINYLQRMRVQFLDLTVQDADFITYLYHIKGRDDELVNFLKEQSGLLPDDEGKYAAMLEALANEDHAQKGNLYWGKVPEGVMGTERTPVASIYSMNVGGDEETPLIEPDLGRLIQLAKTNRRSVECDVRMDIRPDGTPFNVSADCNGLMYKEAAERAVKDAKFRPKVVRGEPVKRINVIYPIRFNLCD